MPKLKILIAIILLFAIGALATVRLGGGNGEGSNGHSTTTVLQLTTNPYP